MVGPSSLSLRNEVFTSEAVIEELEIGIFPGKDNALALVEPLPLLALNDAIADAVAVYIAHRNPGKGAACFSWQGNCRLPKATALLPFPPDSSID